MPVRTSDSVGWDLNSIIDTIKVSSSDMGTRPGVSAWRVRIVGCSARRLRPDLLMLSEDVQIDAVGSKAVHKGARTDGKDVTVDLAGAGTNIIIIVC